MNNLRRRKINRTPSVERDPIDQDPMARLLPSGSALTEIILPDEDSPSDITARNERLLNPATFPNFSPLNQRDPTLATAARPLELDSRWDNPNDQIRKMNMQTRQANIIERTLALKYYENNPYPTTSIELNKILNDLRIQNENDPDDSENIRLYNALNNVRPFTIGATLVLEPKDDFINRTRWQIDNDNDYLDRNLIHEGFNVVPRRDYRGGKTKKRRKSKKTKRKKNKRRKTSRRYKR